MYEDDLAFIQHQGFSDFAKSAGPGVLEILRKAGISRPRSVLAELGRAGFTARTSRSYGTFPLPYRRLAFIATKAR